MRACFTRACALTIADLRTSPRVGQSRNNYVLTMDKDKVKNIWNAVKTIIEVIIGFLCGTQIDTWLGGPLM